MVVVRGGEPARCDGLLYPSQWAAKSQACLEVDLPKCHQNAELVAKTAKAGLVAALARLTTADQGWNQCEDALARATAPVSGVDAVRAEPISPLVWLGAGALGGALAVLLVVVAAK